jgi:hypothetical protein
MNTLEGKKSFEFNHINTLQFEKFNEDETTQTLFVFNNDF